MAVHRLSRRVFFQFPMGHGGYYIGRHQRGHQSVQLVGGIDRGVGFSSGVVDWLVWWLECWTLGPGVPGSGSLLGRSF